MHTLVGKIIVIVIDIEYNICVLNFNVILDLKAPGFTGNNVDN